MANTLLTIGTGFGDTMLVCALGIGIVFIGLVVMIGLVYLMNFVTDKIFGKKPNEKKQEAVVAPASNTEIPNREEIVAAVVAAIAEEEKTDISAIRVVSFKKV